MAQGPREDYDIGDPSDESYPKVSIPKQSPKFFDQKLDMNDGPTREEVAPLHELALQKVAAIVEEKKKEGIVLDVEDQSLLYEEILFDLMRQVETQPTIELPIEETDNFHRRYYDVSSN